VSFGTRHTLSSQSDPARDIGAATRWVFEQLQASAAASGGRMTVVKQSFTQPAGPRIPTPTVITNVTATLRGATSPDRLYAEFKAAGADIQGMFSDDIVGSSTADDGTRDPHTLRLFTEGVPTAETAAQAAIRRAVGGEVDGPSRQLGRFVFARRPPRRPRAGSW